MVLSDTNSERRNSWLGMIHDEFELDMIINRKKNPMEYGILVSWKDWSAKQGKGIHAPHRYLKLRIPDTPDEWSLSMWFVAFLMFALSIGFWWAGVNLFLLLVFDFISYIVLSLGIVVFSSYLYNKPGLCHICGITIPVRPGIQRKSMNPFKRGRMVMHTRAGLCQKDDPNTNNCDWNTTRYSRVKKRCNLLWSDIKANKIRGLIFKVYKDKRNDREYQAKDAKIPLEQDDDDILEEVEGDLLGVVKKVGRIRVRRKLQFVRVKRSNN